MSPSDTQTLTAPQQKTLQILEGFIEQYGYPPTVEELSERLKISKASVHGSLEKLIQKGFVKRTAGKARGLELLRTEHASVIDVVEVPLLGSVPAGTPISTEEHHAGSVYVQSSIVKDQACFALNVVGHSMVNADIRDGDLVIVRKQPLAENGDIVVAAVDGEVTVKRLLLNQHVVRLLPENSDFQPIDIGADCDFRILGCVIATRRVVRRSPK